MADGCRVLAVCGHEAGYGEALRELTAPDVLVVTGGRALIRALGDLGRSGEAACVVPMTLGRDPELVADTARTLRSLPATQAQAQKQTQTQTQEPAHLHPHPHPTLLAEPFGNGRHLVAWLRAAANRVPATSALLVTAPTGGLFEDAELYRIARLVQGYGGRPLVEVAFTGGAPGPAEGVRRCGLLGAREVALLTAAFAPTTLPGAPGVTGVTVASAGPSVSRAALARVLATRVADARRRWSEQGDDGTARGLTAADDHGHSHTHPPGEGHDHGHSPAHPHPHPQVHEAGHVLRSSA